MRGQIDVNVEVFPAFSKCNGQPSSETTNTSIDYARDQHTTEIADLSDCKQGQCRQRVTFRSEKLSLELNATIDCGDEEEMPCPRIVFEKSSTSSSLGDGIIATFRLYEGQAVSFILRDADDHSPELIDTTLVNELQLSTQDYWSRWITVSVGVRSACETITDFVPCGFAAEQVHGSMARGGNKKPVVTQDAHL